MTGTIDSADEPATRTALDELRSLAALRARVREALAEVTPTLQWFAKQQELGGMPASIWKNLDRLPTPPMHGLSPAFDLMHTLQRVERTLRQFDSDAAKNVVDCIERLNTDLKTTVAAEMKRNAAAALIRLLSDDRTGSLTIESAARVLRCGSFPIRIPALPSYIAGHVIFSELRLMRERLQGAGASITADRGSSAAFMAQGVAAVHSFIAMVRSRAKTCAAIARDLRLVVELRKAAESRGGEASKRIVRASLAQERLLFARLAASLRSAGVSILGLRNSVFADAVDQAEQAAAPTRKDEPDLRMLFAKVGQQARGLQSQSNPAMSTAPDHQLGRLQSETFVLDYAQTLETLHASLIGPSERKFDAPDALRRLKRLYTQSRVPLVPSIAQARKVLFLDARLASGADTDDRLTRLFDFMDEDAKLEGNTDAMRRRDEALEREWSLQASTFVERERRASDAGAEAIVTRWIETRFKVFDTAAKLLNDLVQGAEQPERVIEAFALASDRYSEHARQLENMLDEFARLAPAIAQRLLSSCLVDAPERADALELLSALWMCDRTGYGWSEAMEVSVVAALEKLQRPSGAFDTCRPSVEWLHGFVALAPSATAISVLASFLQDPRHGADPARMSPADFERRLARWERMSVKAIEYLIASRVGRAAPGEELTGWQSDVQPQEGRIDLFATCVAARALSGMDEVLSRLINRRAFDGLQVEYPEPEKLDRQFAFDCMSTEADKDEHPVLIGAQRAAEWLAYRTRGFVRSDYLPPTEYRPRTTLYYGPPGTGKTHASRLVAAALRWPLVTVDPHHFLRESEPFVGKVAADIIERLQWASNCCIIFDEFDQLIVDRNIGTARSRYVLVTPTMLPLLAELHDRAVENSCLVAFATNFYALLDAAAVRRGRIDQKSCIVYPDHASRYLYLLITDEQARAEAAKRGTTRASAREEDLLRLANATALRTVSDLIAVGKDVVKHGVARVAAAIDKPDPKIDPWPPPALGAAHYDGVRKKLESARVARELDRVLISIAADASEELKEAVLEKDYKVGREAPAWEKLGSDKAELAD